ncbi:MAG: hypothetical protein WBV93_17755 [Anaerobacillus sp.]
MVIYLLKNWLPFAGGAMLTIIVSDLWQQKEISWNVIISFSIGSLLALMGKWYFKRGKEK